nr:WGxxGxxG-CTERM domain-containing protein [Paenibacillus sp. PL91]
MRWDKQMKKFLLTIGFIGCLMMFSAVPASAETMGTNNNTPGEEIRHDVNRGINNTNRALGTDFDRIGRTNYNGTAMNANNANRANNYRTTAATDDDGFDWGWLGLLGLLGLAGMRNRANDRERDRA